MAEGIDEIGRLQSTASVPRRLMTIDELSALWSVPKATLYNWVNQGRLPYVKLGRSLRFDVVEVEEFRRQGTMGVAGKR